MSSTERTQKLPVAVIGGGPVGLAAAAHLLARGEEPLVFEAGTQVGANIREWGHVRLFSPWRYVVDRASARLLEAMGWEQPDGEEFPTGRDLVERYLEPLAATPELAGRLRLGHRVVAVARLGLDKMKTEGRGGAPFLLRVRKADGSEEEVTARAVIDASGTWQQPNPLGVNGLPALGERAAAARIVYGIPDVAGAGRARYAGRRTAVVGSGHSAFNALLELAALGRQVPGTRITWVVRRPSLERAFGGGANDALTARGELGRRLQRLIEAGEIQVVTGFRLRAVRAEAAGLVLVGEEGALPPVDEVVAATGFRPDLALLSELRLALDPATESPVALAPLIDPNVHSCGTVRPHGAEELKQPEEGLFLVGMKSYGRAPTFLLLTGYEQVRSVAAALAGDWQSAGEVHLALPETGVCKLSSRQPDGGVAAAGAAPELEPWASDSSAAR